MAGFGEKIILLNSKNSFSGSRNISNLCCIIKPIKFRRLESKSYDMWPKGLLFL